MMHDWQAGILIQAMAEMARIEAMKAANQCRETQGYAQAYSEESFLNSALVLDNLAYRITG